MERQCYGCGKTVIRCASLMRCTRTFCSRACRVTSLTIKCHTCGKPVSRQPCQVHNTTFCSAECYSAEKSKRCGRLAGGWRGGSIESVCANCGNVFMIPANRTKSKNVYCSRGCRYAHMVGENAFRWRGGVTAHPKYRAIWRSNKRVEAAGSYGSFNVTEWDELVAKFDGRCARCGKCEPEIHLTPDHIIPINLGGRGWIENIQPLCISCNSKKGRRIIFFAHGIQFASLQDVPAELLVVDDKSLDEYAAAMKEQANVPGVEFFTEDILSARGKTA